MTAWTDEQVARLRDLDRKGYSAAVIAAAIGGFSRCAVLGKLQRLNAKMGARPRRRPTITKIVPAKPKAVKPAESPRRDVLPSIVPPGSSPVAGHMPVPAPPPLFGSGEAASIIVVPMPYRRALAEGRCLFFAADPLTVDGPEMPVCGCHRLAGARKPYCPAHLAAEPARRSVA